MQIVAEFDPSTSTSDTFTVPSSSAHGKLVVYNESNISLRFAFPNGSTAYVPAWTAMLFCGIAGSINVDWEQHTILQSGSPPLSVVVVELYDSTETVTGTFPAPLVRQANLGNSIPVSTSTSSIQNDGNAANTSVVEATVSGDSASAVDLKNNGQMFLGTSANPGYLGVNGEIVANSETVQSLSVQNAISLDGGTIYTSGSGTLTATVLSAGQVKLALNSISHISVASGSGSQTINHGLGGTPDIIIIQLAGNFGGPSNQVPAWYNKTSTQVTVAAQSGYFWYCYCIKF